VTPERVEPPPRPTDATPTPTTTATPPPSTPTPCTYKTFTAVNFRHNLICFTGGYDRPGFEAHHIFPRKFQSQFDQILGVGANNHPVYGTWWEFHNHRANKEKYNILWNLFFNDQKQRGRVPTRAEVIQSGWVIGTFFGLELHFSAPTAGS
jgi:hypothetical protein